MKTKSFNSLVYIFLILFLVGFMSSAWAAKTGKIAGNVFDQATNEPLAGANIQIEGTGMGAAADVEGFFVILNVPPGTYQVRVTMIGYADLLHENVHVSINQTTSLTLSLTEETITTETVVVYAERPMVQLDVSASQKIISVNDIKDRPVDNLEEILAAEAGIAITAGSEGQGLLVRGGQLSETDIVIDGLSTRNERNQQANTTIGLSAIQEIELLTGGFNAEYGDIRSGMVNIITKEGSPNKYSVSFDGKISPAERKHFGPSPYGTDGPQWQVFAGPDAMTGITDDMVESGKYPFTWVGWNDWAANNLEDSDPNNDYTPQQALEIWKWQHRIRKYADKPDYIGDLAISGPVPFTPLTFLLSQRYEDLQLAYPMSRNNSIASTSLLKLTYRVSPTMKVSLNNNYILVKGVSSGFFENSTGIVTGTREGTLYARDNVLSGAGGGYIPIWYDGSFNPIETKQYRGGISLNHVLNPTTFYDARIEYTQFNTDQEPQGLRDTSKIYQVGGVFLDESPRNFAGTVSERRDITGRDYLSGGGRGQDHSEYWGIRVAADLVSQIHSNHEVKIGFSFEYTEFKERREINHGEVREEFEDSPQTWWYYDEKPIRLSAYIQDKMEYEGMIANIGLRLDHMTPGLNQFNLDPGFIFANNNPYTRDAYIAGGYSFEDFTTSDNSAKTYLQPRLGISHPITENSKVFFNYGHFLQPPVVDELFLQKVTDEGQVEGIVPNGAADWPRTIAYEIGVETALTQSLLLRLSGYYKDVSDELTEQNITTFVGTSVQTQANNIYRDIRGIELKLEKRFGSWWYGWIQGEYLVQSYGLTGRASIFEDRQLAEQQANEARQIKTPGVPSVQANITFHTPVDYGPQVFGHHILGAWRLNWSQVWSDGGQVLLNDEAPLEQQIFVDEIDWENTDILLEKRFDYAGARFGVYMHVKNLLNFKGYPNPRDFNRYVSSLKFPHEKGNQKGNDKLGDWDKDYIELGWNSWSQFVNPRDIFFGIRIDF